MTEYKPIKSGVILEPIAEKDFIFGFSAIDNEVKVPDGNWTKYLPKNEKQRQGFESMCCTNFSSTSAIEILMTRLIEEKLISIGNLNWLNKNGYIDDSGHINFSDRYDALISNTTPGSGNSLKAVAEAKHKKGLIPEKMLPWVDNETTYFDKSKITPEMTALGYEFIKRFPINYEMVYRNDYVSALRVSPLAGAVFAWNGISNGVYYKVANQINHAIAIIEPSPVWQIFDSYEPYIKKLADDYNYYDYAIRYIVGDVPVTTENSVKKNLYKLLRDPQNPNEVYAFNEQMNAKRHVANKQTLIEGARVWDQYWVWDTTTPIVAASQAEFDGAYEAAEIILVPADSSSAGSKFNFWKWLLVLFRSNN